MLRKRHKCKNEFRILGMFFDNLLSVVAAATTENRLKTKLLVFENGAEKKKKRGDVNLYIFCCIPKSYGTVKVLKTFQVLSLAPSAQNTVRFQNQKFNRLQHRLSITL